MAIQTTSNLSNSIKTQYQMGYMEGVEGQMLYDQFARPPEGIPLNELMKGSSIQVQFLSVMQPGVTAISEIADVVPQTLRDQTASITPTSRGEALKFSELLSIENFTDYEAEAAKRVGENAMESIDIVAYNAALAGNLVLRAAARASLDAGTAGHRLSDTAFIEASTMLSTLRAPYFVGPNGENKMWAAVMHPRVYHDLRLSTNILAVGQYQNQEIIMNWEVGSVGDFRIIKSPFAKVFGSAGADNGTAAASTLAGDESAGSTSIVTAGDIASSVVVGDFITIGTEETGSTFYPTNELVRVTSATTTTVNIIGSGDNGGLRYDHAAGEAVRNADHVYPVLYAGPDSLAKVYASEVGEYGKILPPHPDGNLEQWTKLAWKWYGGYAILSQSHVLRGEYASSLDA